MPPVAFARCASAAARAFSTAAFTAAVNAAVEKARAAADAHISKATGGIKIPGVG